MSKIFEIRLKAEFEYLQKLQRNANVKDIITIWYAPRGGTQRWIPITQDVTGLYPVKFRVRYKMPMYVVGGKLKRDWEGTITFEVTEEALMQGGSMGVGIEGGGFPDDSIPLNKHVSKGFICAGNAWEVAMQGFGIFYIVSAIGSRVNLDSAWQAPTGDHLSAEGREFFENVRHRKPTNNIKWPYNLRDIGFSINPVQTKPKPMQTKKLFTIK